ncbi:Hypothetical protein FKW44_004831, partial [Caligus rogercresseyi]
MATSEDVAHLGEKSLREYETEFREALGLPRRIGDEEDDEEIMPEVIKGSE